MTLLSKEESQTVTLALGDLGEFARFHPYGKTILEKLGAKEKAMELLNDRNRAIREAALLCTQKIMIHQWQRINF